MHGLAERSIPSLVPRPHFLRHKGTGVPQMIIAGAMATHPLSLTCSTPALVQCHILIIEINIKSHSMNLIVTEFKLHATSSACMDPEVT